MKKVSSKSLGIVQCFLINVNLVFGGYVSETNDFAIIGIPDITIDKVIEEQIVDDGEVGVTFEVGLEWEFGSLDIDVKISGENSREIEIIGLHEGKTKLTLTVKSAAE